ncbi:balbiani ring protein 3-like isoform X4 [Homarus americanus]|uniref:balbiani ring protein 3-like isoform X4 n=1 Tax=Homarus americanus TaxID=6706 RepID=UPI001C45646F|nr:balbiani ring protein 3-like isoform X4 [Homarus americanus]
MRSPRLLLLLQLCFFVSASFVHISDAQDIENPATDPGVISSECNKAGGKCILLEEEGEGPKCSFLLNSSDCPQDTSCCLFQKTPGEREEESETPAEEGTERKRAKRSTRNEGREGTESGRNYDKKSPTEKRKSKTSPKEQRKRENEKSLDKSDNPRKKIKKNRQEKKNGKQSRKKGKETLERNRKKKQDTGSNKKQKYDKRLEKVNVGTLTKKISSTEREKQKKKKPKRKKPDDEDDKGKEGKMKVLKKQRTGSNKEKTNDERLEKVKAGTLKKKISSTKREKQKEKPRRKKTDDDDDKGKEGKLKLVMMEGEGSVEEARSGKPKGCKVLKGCKKRGGKCKKKCKKNETRFKKGCKGQKCVCCGKRCKAKKPCKNRNGSCKSSCRAGEEVVANGCKGGKGCVCCASSQCNAKTNCKNFGGRCKSVCKDTEVVIKDGCDGDGCFCCAPDFVGCPATSECPGRCTETCQGVVSNVQCLGESCTCCLDCKVTPSCEKQHGSCKSGCSCGEVELPGGCTGNGCKCCVAHVPACSSGDKCSGNCMYGPLCTGELGPGSCSGEAGCACCTECNAKTNCKNFGGSCKSVCKDTEVVIKDGCDRDGCFCCAPDFVGCPATSECPGRCTDTCQGVVSSVQCLGGNCTCCLDCKVTPSCEKQHGSCKADCSCGEVELPGGCTGNGCKCCVPQVPQCSSGNQCSGTCLYGPLCTGDLRPGSCTGEVGCACCRECKTKTNCKDFSGSCKSVCKDTEVVIKDGCDGDGCFCCAPDFVGCPATSECPGRCTDTCHGVVSSVQCLGGNCTCCLDCKVTPSCEKQHGSCKADCSCGEMELPGGCTGNGCKCCVPQVPQCSSGDQCSGTCLYGPLCTGDLRPGSCTGEVGCACCRECKAKTTCQNFDGSCKSVCKDTEVVIKDGCDGDGCFCCAPDFAGCPATSECPGRCTDTCQGVVSSVQCLGGNCTCCLDCKMTPSCEKQHGSCKADCSCGELELPGGCTGNGCKCCVPQVPQCSNGNQCSGKCLYGPLCTGELSPGPCSGEAGCACCAEIKIPHSGVSLM